MRPGWAKKYLIFSTRLELAKKSDFSDRSMDKNVKFLTGPGR
jgi:hypothetical protein